MPGRDNEDQLAGSRTGKVVDQGGAAATSPDTSEVDVGQGAQWSSGQRRGRQDGQGDWMGRGGDARG